MKKFLFITCAFLALIFAPELSNAANVVADCNLSELFNFAGSAGTITLATFGLSAAQLEAEAMQRLSNYDGNNYDGDNYVGMDDDAVDFQGAGRSFLTELNSNLSFGFSINNALTTRQVIALTPSFLLTAANIAAYLGQTVDGVLTDGTIKTSVTATALQTKRKIAFLQEFIKNNPTRITEMVVQADNDGQLEEQIVLAQVSPFRDLANNVLLLTNYVDPRQLNTKKAVIPLALEFPQFQLDDQNIILLPVTPGTVKVTFKIGAIRNNASQLYNKAKRAYNNAQRVGLIG